MLPDVDASRELYCVVYSVPRSHIRSQHSAAARGLTYSEPQPAHENIGRSDIRPNLRCALKQPLAFRLDEHELGSPTERVLLGPSVWVVGQVAGHGHSLVSRAVGYRLRRFRCARPVCDFDWRMYGWRSNHDAGRFHSASRAEYQIAQKLTIVRNQIRLLTVASALPVAFAVRRG